MVIYIQIIIVYDSHLKIKEKIFLNLHEIKQIIISRGNKEIETHKENKINFFSFDDFNSVYNKINSIFKLYTEYELKG